MLGYSPSVFKPIHSSSNSATGNDDNSDRSNHTFQMEMPKDSIVMDEGHNTPAPSSPPLPYTEIPKTRDLRALEACMEKFHGSSSVQQQTDTSAGGCPNPVTVHCNFSDGQWGPSSSSFKPKKGLPPLLRPANDVSPKCDSCTRSSESILTSLAVAVLKRIHPIKFQQPSQSLCDFMAEDYSPSVSRSTSSRSSCGSPAGPLAGPAFDSVHHDDILKNYLNPARAGFVLESQFIGSDPKSTEVQSETDFELTVRGTFFRACMRPPCLQDKRLQAMRSAHMIGKPARYTMLVLCLVIIMIGDCLTHGSTQDREWEIEAYAPVRCALGALLLPYLVCTLPQTTALLHLWIPSLVVLRWCTTLLQDFVQNGGRTWTLVTWELLPVLSIGITATTIGVFQWTSSANASKLVKDDQAAYDRVWQKVTNDSKNMMALNKIKNHAQVFYCKLPFVEQCLLSNHDHPSDVFSRTPSGSFVAPRAIRVKSIDQLHQQSMLLQPLLSQRVQSWALASKGWFRWSVDAGDEGDLQFVRWDQVHLHPETVRGIVRARPKSFARSVQKAVELYNFDVSRVCDVTRETVWFETVEDIMECLSEVTKDWHTQVAGIKNAMDPAGSSYSTGGFRFVKLQVRLATEETLELGLEGHVSEVLLVLKTMEECKEFKGPEAHRKYVEWRKALAVWSGWVRIKEKKVSRLFSGNPRRWAGPFAATVKERAAEELERTKSQHKTLVEMSRRRSLSTNSWNVCSNENLNEWGDLRMKLALRATCMNAMKTYLWSTNTDLYGLTGKQPVRTDGKEYAIAALENTSTASSFRMKQPIASAITRPRFQATLMLLGLLMTVLNAAGIFSLCDDNLSCGRTFRFTHIAGRNFSDPSWPGIENFDLTQRGVPVKGQVEWRRVGKNSMTIHYDRDVLFNGWVLTTSREEAPERDAVRFKLERRRGPEEGAGWREGGIRGVGHVSQCSFTEGEAREEVSGSHTRVCVLQDTHTQWELVGASSWFKEVGWPFVWDFEEFATPFERGESVNLSLDHEWHAFLLPLGGVIVGLTMCGAAVCGIIQKPLSGERLIKVWMLVAAAVHWLATLLLRSGGQRREAMHVLSWTLASMCWNTVAHFAPAYVLEAMTVVGLINCLGHWHVVTTIYHLGGLHAVDPVGVLYIVIGLTCKAMVLFNEWRVAQGCRRDLKVYQHAWEVLSCEDEMTGMLDRIKALTDIMTTEHSDARQRVIPYPSSMDDSHESLDSYWWAECVMSDSDRCFQLSPAAESIDQLYAQAEVAAVVVRHKLFEWADISGGFFLLSDAAGRKRSVHPMDVTESDMQEISRASIKKAPRALEKTFRGYGGDSSRLLDLSRHTIVFQKPAHILACLELLLDDPDVRVVRVKNNMHSSVACPSGYRSVLVNVQVVKPETEKMGVSMHISEVQLITLPFAVAKTSGGHRRYVQARNAKGE